MFVDTASNRIIANLQNLLKQMAIMPVMLTDCIRDHPKNVSVSMYSLTTKM